MPPHKSWRVRLCWYCDEKSASIRTFRAAETAPEASPAYSCFLLVPSVRESRPTVIVCAKTCDYSSSHSPVIAQHGSISTDERKRFTTGKNSSRILTRFGTFSAPDAPYPKFNESRIAGRLFGLQ